MLIQNKAILHQFSWSQVTTHSTEVGLQLYISKSANAQLDVISESFHANTTP